LTSGGRQGIFKVNSQRDSRIDEYGLVRVANLPFQILDELLACELADISIQVERAERELAFFAEKICKRLEFAVQQPQTSTDRHLLLDVKRAVHNARPVDVQSACHALEAIKHYELSNELREWRACVLSCHNLRAQGEGSIGVAKHTIEAGLASIWDNEYVKTAVMLAQPRLYERLESTLTKTRVVAGRKDEKLLDTLLAYVYRMATKTTPFGGFTTIGVSRVTGSTNIFPSLSNLERTSTYSLSAYAVDLLAHQLPKCKGIRHELLISTNKTAILRDHFIDFISFEKGGYGAPGVSGIPERLINLDKDCIISTLIDAASNSFYRQPLGDLISMLSEISGNSIEQTSQYCERLIQVGFLYFYLGYDENSLHGQRQISRYLANVTENSMGLVDLLDRVDDLLHVIGNSRHYEKIQLIHAVQGCVERFLASATSNDKVNPAQSLIRHETRFRNIYLLPKSKLMNLERSLADVCGVLPLFNSDRVIEKFITARYLSIYGEDNGGVGITEFFKDLCLVESGSESPSGDGMDPFATALATGILDGELVALRQKLIEELLEYIGNGLASRICLSEEFFDRWSQCARSYWPDLVKPSATVCGHFFEDLERRGNLNFVVNKITGGYGMLMASAASDTIQKEAGYRLREFLVNSLDKKTSDADVVELVGTFAFDGQIRPRLTDYYIKYPGDHSIDKTPNEISWNELAVSFDKTKGRIVLLMKSSGRRVVPIHLGSLSPIYFPPLYRLLCAFGPCYSPELPLLDLMDRRRKEWEDNHIRHYPRIVYRDVVVSRESWAIPAIIRPRQEKSESDFSFFHRMRLWAKSIDLPRQTFVTPLQTLEYLEGSWSPQQFRRLHKPFFVDWDAYTSHRLLKRFCQLDGATMIISEALPCFLRTGQTAPHSIVSEHVLQVSL
jgi:hypothetical protein